jgi:hypothetical protein
MPLTVERSKDAAWALTQLRRRRERYLLYEAYYHGLHRLAFASDRFENAFGNLFREFADNLCPTVVDSLVDRLQVTGFADNGAEGAAAEASATVAGAVWALNEGDVQSGGVMQDAALFGDGYVIVWPDAALMPRMYPQMPTECVVRYSPERPGEVLFGAKVWRREEDRKARLTLYYPDRIEHFITRNKAQGIPEKPDRFVDYTDEGPSYVANGFGIVPVFHFANGPGLGRPGVSELQPVIPLQDALNKALVDMLVAMEFVAFPQRWATGVEERIDPRTGKEEAPFKAGVERLWTSSDAESRFGQFPAADLAQHVKVQDSLRLSIARVAGRPVHLFKPEGGTPPSGEALKMEEARLVKKARDRMRSWGRVWANSVTLAMRQAAESTAGELVTLWEAPETRQVREEAEVAILKGSSGVSERQRQRELGYTEEEIDRMAEERAAEREAGAAAFAAGAVD